MFELVFMMTKGGPAGTTEILPYYIYVTAFQLLDIGYAAALAVLMLILVNVLAVIFIGRIQMSDAAGR